MLAGLLLSSPVHAQACVSGGGRWDALVASYLDAYFEARPSAAASAGRHEYDARLPDWSEPGLTTFDTLLTNWRARVVAFDTLALDAARRLERLNVLASLDRELWSLKTVDNPHRNPAYYSGALDPGMYLTRPYAPLRQRMRAYIRYARSATRAAPRIQANLRPPLARTMIDRGRGAFGGFATCYRTNVPAVFASVKDPALQRELARANDSAVVAMRTLDDWLEAQRATQTEGFALGAEKFREMLYATERVDTPLEELERIGRADLARNQAALRSECARFAPAATVADCMRKADAHKPRENTVVAARRQLTVLRRFLVDHDIVSLPSDFTINSSRTALLPSRSSAKR